MKKSSTANSFSTVTTGATLGNFKLPTVQNEVMRSYAPGSVERAGLQQAIKAMQVAPVEVPCVINGQKAERSLLVVNCLLVDFHKRYCQTRNLRKLQDGRM
jgi:hypothetical protein